MVTAAPTPTPLPPRSRLRLLTSTEKEVVGLVGMCYTDREIAALRHRSLATILNQMVMIRRKLQIKNRPHLCATAIHYGLGHPPSPQ